MIKKYNIFVFFLFSVFWSLSCHAKAETEESYTLNGQAITIKTNDVDFSKFQICNLSACQNIKLSNADFISINKKDFSKRFLHFKGDETAYIAFEHANKNVNSCVILFRYDQSRNALVKTELKDYEACNIKSRDGLLISSSREGATWIERAYKVKNGNIIPYLLDKELDCNTFKRTEKKNNSTKQEISNYLVDHSEKMENRKILSASVVAQRSDIYSSSNIESPTKKYLIAGDSVTLLDYSYSEISGERYEITFQGKNKTTYGWIMSSTVKRVPPEQSCYP
jgi:hypothetical protein